MAINFQPASPEELARRGVKPGGANAPAPAPEKKPAKKPSKKEVS